MVTAVASNSGSLYHRIVMATCNNTAPFTNLLLFTNYHVNISGITSVGVGPPTQVFVVNAEQGTYIYMYIYSLQVQLNLLLHHYSLL